MTSRWNGSIAITVALWAATSLASAQSLPEGLRACAADTDDTRRLACYDREVRGALKTTGSASAAAPISPSMAPVLTPEQKFGMSGGQVRKAEGVADLEEAKPTKLQAHVTSIKEQRDGKLLLTLDNGQVWRQTETTPPLDFKAGEAVVIEPGALGSFWLKGESRRAIRVKRSR